MTKVKTADFYKNKSFWLENCQDNLTPRPSLEESKVVDIAIMGAGFTGLWTAYYLIRQNPSLNIVILEKEITGYGASGRNGGWCYPVFSVTPSTLLERYGKSMARELQLAMFDSVTEIGNVIEKENIQCDWTIGGGLKVSLGQQGIPSLENELLTYKKMGIDAHYQLLNKSQLEKRVRIQGAERGIYTKHSAVLNPAKLARQLANVLEGYGVKIYEQTEVQKIKEGTSRKGSRLITQSGSVTANIASVIAGEAYVSQLKEFQRKVIPMYSLITLTEPLTKQQWSEIGWESRESIGSTRYSINYLQRTRDGRILFGGRGQPYRFGSKIKDSFDVHGPTHKTLQQMLKKWFPSLNNIGFTHSWGGPVGITRDWTPNFQFNKHSRIANAWGYVGQGVSTTNLAGRILRDLIYEKESSLTKLPMVQHQSRNWEMEPLRWIGARFVQNGLERVDRKSEKTGFSPTGNTLAERIGLH
ncbi:NAD(P)/FAD-dependent oxidoreductase [Alteribacillus iranensis]|uniref:Glycine/D-amino acid oxidase n=1 Tax=Alteribacillus iranensis TaxID=930128 RepID=A0A1I2DJE5_9BACI|nr:FAD-dependent oxidoreductase [Alteribacillus iranensis]SFE80569.1 Glycine/D-amino acid oxidase [Alteribacillus iranensis]